MNLQVGRVISTLLQEQAWEVGGASRLPSPRPTPLLPPDHRASSPSPPLFPNQRLGGVFGPVLCTSPVRQPLSDPTADTAIAPELPYLSNLHFLVPVASAHSMGPLLSREVVPPCPGLGV